ncbi:MAG TPA: hypothetical protein VEG60_30865 [Candidatus Binatia bacterium]|nr:hypothetical protein [Candidatus Binatia bacterium]
MFAVQIVANKRTWLRYQLCSLIFALYFMGCIESVDHDAAAAGKKAEEFARITFVKQDIETGYALLADGTKRYVSRDQFRAVVSKLHPRGFPKTVTALEYEPMPGEKAIFVFLTGNHSGEHFYYRLTMEGTASTGYKVLRLDRASQPYPSANEKKRF